MSETPPADTPRETYCGIRPCGCVVTIISKRAPQIEGYLETMRREGLDVQLLPTDEALSRITFCEHRKEKSAQLGLFEEEA